MKPAGLLALLAVAPAAAQPTVADGPVFMVAGLHSAVAGEAVIGHRRSGLICGPAGVLRWRDVAPDAGRAARATAAAMRGAGLDVFVPDPDVSEGQDETAPVRIVGTVAAASLDVCTAWRGLKLSGSQPGAKLRGRLAVVWRAYDRRTRALIVKVTTCGDVRVEGASTERAVQAAIEKLAAAAAPELGSAGASADRPLPARSLGCRPAELAQTADAEA